MSFTQEIKTFLGWRWDTAGALDRDSLSYLKRFSDVVGDLENMAVWHLEDQVLADGDTIHWDLSALVREVLDADISHAFSKVFAIMIVNLNTRTETGTLTFGDADWDEWWQPFGRLGDTVQIPPDSMVQLVNRDGWPVETLGPGSSSSSGEGNADRMLKLAAADADVTYSIAITGAIADVTESSSSGA
jgi:hypothetical protein